MTKKNHRIPVRSLIIAVIVLSVVVYFIQICVESLNQNFVERGWKVTLGTVLDPIATLKDKRSVSRKNQGIEQTINYEYTVNGVHYKSNSVAREAFVNAEDYPEGKIVNVYYNPKDPTETLLIRTQVQVQYLYGMIVACIVVVFVVFIFLIRDFKNAG